MRPTIQQIATRVEADVVTELGLSGPPPRYGLARFFGRVITMVSHEIHGAIAYLQDQILPDRCDAENLDRHASVDGFTKNAAIKATSTFNVTGTTGVDVPVGREVFRADGVGYITTSSVTLYAGAGVVSITALKTGSVANADAGTVLSFASPIPGVDTSGTSGAIIGGYDGEKTEPFRARFLEDRKNESTGGNDADWVSWAKEVAGVTRAWAFPLEGGLGKVTVRFVRDEDVSIFPDGAEVATVNAHLQTKRPATCTLTTAAPTNYPVVFSIAIDPDTPETRAAIALELDDLFYRMEWIGDTGGTVEVLRADLQAAVGIGAAGADWNMTVPGADLTPPLGALATRSTITWL